MKCYVYKGDKKEDFYLYLPAEFDPQSPSDDLPSAILALMGELRYILAFDLTLERQLPQADAQHVLDSIESKGFYLQMPKKDMKALEDALFA